MYGARVVEARIKAASAFFGGETGTWMASRHLFPFPFFPLHLGIFPYFVLFSFLFFSLLGSCDYNSGLYFRGGIGRTPI